MQCLYCPKAFPQGHRLFLDVSIGHWAWTIRRWHQGRVGQICQCHCIWQGAAWVHWSIGSTSCLVYNTRSHMWANRLGLLHLGLSILSFGLHLHCCQAANPLSNGILLSSPCIFQELVICSLLRLGTPFLCRLENVCRVLICIRWTSMMSRGCVVVSHCCKWRGSGEQSEHWGRKKSTKYNKVYECDVRLTNL